MTWPDAAAPQERGLRERAARAVKWTGLSMVVTTAAQFAQLAVLARLLAPSGFGAVVATGTVAGVALAFGDAGLANAIIQRRDVSGGVLSSLWWANLGVGLAVGIGVFAARGTVAGFFRMPVLSETLGVMWAVFAVTGLGQVQQALLQKNLHFRGIAAGDAASSVVGLTISAWLAVAGYGPVCFAWGQLGGATGRVLVLWGFMWREWRPRVHFKVSEVVPFVSFALYQLGERLTNYLAANTDYILAGRFLGASALGAYSVAYQLVVLPLTKMNPVFNRVAFPAFAMRQDDDAALARGYCEVSKVIAYATVPLLAVLAVTAPIAVPLVVGSQWAESAVLVRILATLGLAKSLANPGGSVLLAKGRADWAFWWNAVALGTNAVVLGLTVRFGLIPLALSYSALAILQYVALQAVVLRLGRMRLRAYVASIGPAFAAGAVAVAVMVASFGWLSTAEAGRVTILGTTAALGAAVYVALYAVIDRGYQTGLVHLLRRSTGGP